MKNIIFILFSSCVCFSQSNTQKIQAFLFNNKEEKMLTTKDIYEWKIQSSQKSNSTNIINYRIVQNYLGIEIFDTQSNVWMKDNEVLKIGNRFKNNILQKVNSNIPVVSVIEALKKSYIYLGITPTDFTISSTNDDNSFQLTDGIQEEAITGKLGYQSTHNDKLALAWSFQLYSPDTTHYWDIKIDAINGNLIEKTDLTINCNFHKSNTSLNKIVNNYNFEQNLFHSKPALINTTSIGNYRVIPYNYTSPNHHAFELISTSGNALASPNGWHDANNIGETNPLYLYTITRGNNIYAQEDSNGDNGAGLKPDGGASLLFDYPYGGTTAIPTTYTSAATTNVFYMTNIMHDVWYQYGFDEVNGNFQRSNLNRGGTTTITGDPVFVDSQDGYANTTSPKLNNANFSPTNDGSRPRIQMYLWNYGANTSSYLYADGDFDNGIIAHEYGHGISNRLVGGGFAQCMTNYEQMGEGWSDWFGLMMQLKTGDIGTTKKPIGTYVVNQSNFGGGIRSYPYDNGYPYSTSMSLNPLTLDDSNYPVPTDPENTYYRYVVGKVWASILWDLNWAYINQYGFDPDIYNGTGGNNKVMQLVLDALKLETCNETSFINSRNNIFAADLASTGGANYDMIAEVFRRRGVGMNATSGDVDDSNDQVEDFTAFPLSTKKFSKDDTVRIYPNPTNGLLNIRINQFVGKVNIQVVDINGRVVFNQTDDKFNVEKAINLNSFQSGVYIVKINTDKINYSQKLIKQ